MNTLCIGPTGSGKSEGVIPRIGPACVVIDPHDGSLAWKGACQLVSKPVLFDDLKRTDKVLTWQFLAPSTMGGIDGEIENEEALRAFADVLIRDRGMTTLARTPLIEEGIVTVLEAWLARPEVPLYELHRAYDPEDEVFAKIESWRMRNWRFMSRTQLRNDFGAAERIMRRVLRSPAFRIRCGEGFNHTEFLSRGGTILVQGGGIAADGMRITLGAIIQRILQDAKARRFTQPVKLIIDEAGRLIGGYEANALAELRKYDLDIILIDQTGDFGEFTELIWQNCQRIEVYGCNSEAIAEKIGKLISLPTLDPYQVHDYVRRERQVHDGFFEEDGKMLPKYRDEFEETARHRTLGDQIHIGAKQVMNLELGERIVKEGRTVTTESFSKVKEAYPWGLSETYAKENIEKWLGVYGTKPSSHSSPSIPPPWIKFDKSADSPRTKQPHGEWRRLQSEKSSDAAAE